MRKMLMFAGLVLLGSAVGCAHTDSGCSSCGSGCGSGCSRYHHPCAVGVCDCDIPPLSPYNYPRAAMAAAAEMAPAPVGAPATPPNGANGAHGAKEMPKDNGQTPDK